MSAAGSAVFWKAVREGRSYQVAEAIRDRVEIAELKADAALAHRVTADDIRAAAQANWRHT